MTHAIKFTATYCYFWKGVPVACSFLLLLVPFVAAILQLKPSLDAHKLMLAFWWSGTDYSSIWLLR